MPSACSLPTVTSQAPWGPVQFRLLSIITSSNHHHHHRLQLQLQLLIPPHSDLVFPLIVLSDQPHHHHHLRGQRFTSTTNPPWPLPHHKKTTNPPPQPRPAPSPKTQPRSRPPRWRRTTSLRTSPLKVCIYLRSSHTGNVSLRTAQARLTNNETTKYRLARGRDRGRQQRRDNQAFVGGVVGRR